MSKVELVEEIDDRLKIQTIFVSVTNKDGLVSNTIGDTNEVIEDLSADGIIGALVNANPDILIISTGGTAKHIEEAGYKVMEVSDYAKWPEMETGLVKSMHPKLYVGMLAHIYTKSDATYLKKHDIPPLDMTIVNLYPFEETVADNPLDANPQAFEIIRQQMDAGGINATHNSRKGFISTVVATSVEDYAIIVEDLINLGGKVSYATRFKLVQRCSEVLFKYFKAIYEFLKETTYEQALAPYKIHNTD